MLPSNSGQENFFLLSSITTQAHGRGKRGRQGEVYLGVQNFGGVASTKIFIVLWMRTYHIFSTSSKTSDHNPRRNLSFEASTLVHMSPSACSEKFMAASLCSKSGPVLGPGTGCNYRVFMVISVPHFINSNSNSFPGNIQIFINIIRFHEGLLFPKVIETLRRFRIVLLICHTIYFTFFSGLFCHFR